MADKLTFTLKSPITDEQWNKITDVDFEHTDRIWFETKHGKVEFLKASAQSEQKVGRWVDDGTELGFCCSECGSTFDDYFYGDLSDVSMCKVPKFCPNCGKKMEEQYG